MPLSRRDLLKAGLSAAAVMMVPEPLLARFGDRWEPVPPVSDPRVKELALRAMEAARAAGAAYADVRLTHTRTRSIGVRDVSDQERLAVGVRALVDGYWGFASGPVWSTEEMVRLGREAVYQAQVGAAGPKRFVELAPTPPVRDGHWDMPVEIDPFEVSPFEIMDHLRSLSTFVTRFRGFTVHLINYQAVEQEKAFASTEGSYCTQRLHRSNGVLTLDYVINNVLVDRRGLDTLTPAGVGWELFKGQPIREQLRRLIEEMEEDHKLPAKPVEVGRYDVVCDALTVARLLDQTLGEATQLDRALGYEANAGGTSFLSDPLAMMGSYEIGAGALSVIANRSEPGGAATVRWDDEGVRPEDAVLIRDGVVVDFQTTRESAAWLADRYAKAGRTVRSHGYAAAPSAISVPMGHTPNLAISPARDANDFDSLVAALENGLAVREMSVDMDFQRVNGSGSGRLYEVKGGKRVARIGGAGFLFRATELWKGLIALGGEESLRRYGVYASKGEPPQSTVHSVTAPPAAFRQMTVIDPKRKA